MRSLKFVMLVETFGATLKDSLTAADARIKSSNSVISQSSEGRNDRHSSKMSRRCPLATRATRVVTGLDA